MSNNTKTCNDCDKNEDEVVLVKYPFTTAYGGMEGEHLQLDGCTSYTCLDCIERRERLLSGAGKPSVVVKQIVDRLM